MLRIRLRRVGKKKQPMYRIVVADSHAPRDGAFVESLGYYHPMDNPSTIVVNDERAKHWLEQGAMPSDRVAKIFKIQGLAELPPKLVTRIALGDQRAKDAAKEKAKSKASAEDASAADAPAAEAKAEAPAKDAKAEAPAAEAKAEAPADTSTEAPVADAKADTPAEDKAVDNAGDETTDEKKADA